MRTDVINSVEEKWISKEPTEARRQTSVSRQPGRVWAQDVADNGGITSGASSSSSSYIFADCEDSLFRLGSIRDVDDCLDGEGISELQ